MMRKKLPADRAMGTRKPMKKPQWTATALAVAATVVLGAWTSEAKAMALGRVTVQSALGEPLRADIDIPEINAEEAASLKAVVASPAAFRAAGLEFSPAISGIQITLQRRADGQYFLRLSSDRAVNEPFVDLILEANWSSGRIVRDYTMLFDPPNLRQASPQAPATAQVSPVSPPAPAVGAPVARMPAAPATAPAGRASSRAPAPSAPPVERSAPTEGGQRVTVQSGDTAGKIAAAHKPATISLDQMLVALLRSNPDAFAGGNVNRLKAGAVLEVPDAEQAAAIASGEASRTVIAQSRDFNEFRRRLAEGSTPTVATAPDRSVSGKVQTQVEDRKPAAAAPDKLTLSKGAVKGKAAEEKIARERADKEAKTRVAELNKNIADLNKLGATPVTPAASAPRTPGVPVPPVLSSAASAPRPAASAPVASAASAPRPAIAASPAPVVPPAPVASAARPVPAPAAVVVPPPVIVASAPAPAPVVAPPAPAVVTAPVVTAPPVADPASAPAANPSLAAASAASAPAPVAVAPAPVVKKPAPPPPPVETSLVDDLLGNPIVPAAAGGLLALLLGFGFYRARQRKKSAQVDSSFLESRLQPDSFFGASGGQRIDTAEGSSVTGSSMVYSPSQLDAAGDVDPVAEADVYLAYGRDLQAEEILKEALRTNPQRVAIHSKLLEIYSKRRDGKAFELAATEAYNLTHGEGPDWEHICALGQELDPGNPLYRPGGQPMDGTAAAAAGGMAAAGAFQAAGTTQPMPIETQPGAVDSVDLDLDLDFSLGDEPPAGRTYTSEPTIALKTVPLAAAPKADFSGATVPMTPPAPVPEMPMLQATQPVTALEAPNLTLPGGTFDFNPEPVRPAAAPVADSGMIEFDLGSLSLDLDKQATSRDGPGSTAGALLTTAGAPLSPEPFDDTGGDPLATKLALAEEFNAIGDADGARSLAEEVRAEASGDLKGRAERFLAELG